MTYLSAQKVDDMIKEWQQSCADHPAIYNQGNVLRDRLDALAKRHQPLRSGGVALNSTQILLRDMAEALEAHGITIFCPWDGDLSDEEQERFEGLVAVLDVVEKATEKAASDMNEHVAAMIGAMGTPFRSGVFHYTDAEGDLVINDQDALRKILTCWCPIPTPGDAVLKELAEEGK